MAWFWVCWPGDDETIPATRWMLYLMARFLRKGMDVVADGPAV